MPTLAYPLTATNFNEEQCQEIMKRALASTLPAMGINRHFPRVVAHGPGSHQGLEIPNLYTEQLIAHIITLLWFGPQQNDPTGHLLNLAAEDFRLEAGLSGQLFQMLLEIFPYLTTSWFLQTWHQCQLLDIGIKRDVKDFERPRRYDKEIMCLFIQHGIRGTELATMNRCQMYIHTMYLSDICTGDGKAIDTRFWIGKEKCHSTFRWPRTE